MIFDTIRNKDNYSSQELISKALDYLERITVDTMPKESVVLIKDVLFANPVTLNSKPEDQCIYEAHKKYIDLHYILEGIEGIATADTSSLKETIPYNSEKDIAFYTGEKDGQYFLKPGQFMVCLPTDAHMVAIMKDSPRTIKKIVVKIKVEE